MKLVREFDHEENVFVVNDHIVKKGIYFDIVNEDLLCNAEPELFEEFLNQRDTEEGKIHFEEYLNEHKIDFKILQTETCIELKTLKEYIAEYKFHYYSEMDSYTDSKDILSYQIETYIEYWDGCNWVQKYVIDNVEDLECIGSNIERVCEKKDHQIDLYKSEDDTLYEAYDSYFQGVLTSATIITEEELMIKYKYKKD